MKVDRIWAAEATKEVVAGIKDTTKTINTKAVTMETTEAVRTIAETIAVPTTSKIKLHLARTHPNSRSRLEPTIRTSNKPTMLFLFGQTNESDVFQIRSVIEILTWVKLNKNIEKIF